MYDRDIFIKEKNFIGSLGVIRKDDHDQELPDVMGPDHHVYLLKDADNNMENHQEPIRWAEISSSGIYEPVKGEMKKELLGSVGIIRDISNRVRSEKNIRKIANEWVTTFN